MTEQEMLEVEKHWCENCCNFDKERMLPDGYSICKVTNMLAYSECCGKDCRFFNVPAENLTVLPCKVGEKVYIIKRCRCGNPENYDLKVCGRKIVSKTPKVLARVMFQETGKRLKPNYTGKIEYEVVPKGTICYSVYEKQFTLKLMTEIGKTVFLTREEAEKALKGGTEEW